MHFEERITTPRLRPEELQGKTHLGDQILEGATRDREGEQTRGEQPAPLTARSMRFHEQRDTQERPRGNHRHLMLTCLMLQIV